MLNEMIDADAERFMEKVAAATIANQAVIRCLLRGMPVTVDNVILCVTDFLDPNDEKFVGLIGEIERAIEITVGSQAPYTAG